MVRTWHPEAGLSGVQIEPSGKAAPLATLLVTTGMLAMFGRSPEKPRSSLARALRKS